MTKYKSSKTQEKHSGGNTADTGIGNKRLPLLPPPPPVKSWTPPSGVASFRPCRPRPTLFQKVKKNINAKNAIKWRGEGVGVSKSERYSKLS